MANFTDKEVQFIVNRMSRSTFKTMLAAGEIQGDELYMVDDDVLSADNQPIDEVAAPTKDSHAANKMYVDTKMATGSAYSLVSVTDGHLHDRCINMVTMTGDIAFTFPTPVYDYDDNSIQKARDFLLNITVNTAGQITLPNDITTRGDALALTAGKQYFIMFTEFEPTKFLVRVMDITETTTL